MGLDMYLTKKYYVKNWDHMRPEDLTTVTVTRNGKSIVANPSKICYVEEEVAYWRKANQIHAWFVDNVQNGNDDCGHYYVDPEKLLELVDLCKRVLADHSLAPELLPSQSGFFFGGTDYDEWYFKDLENTIHMLKPYLAEYSNQNFFHSGDFYYHSSW